MLQDDSYTAPQSQPEAATAPVSKAPELKPVVKAAPAPVQSVKLTPQAKVDTSANIKPKSGGFLWSSKLAKPNVPIVDEAAQDAGEDDLVFMLMRGIIIIKRFAKH